MAETRPFRALHYTEADLSALVCPPFDVISLEEQGRLYERNPFNAVRLEYGETRLGDTASSNRYSRAAATLREWIESGVLVHDDAPALYVDDQQFTHEGRLLTRRSLFARVRLHDWDEGPVRPHERTLDRPKEDRIQLLRACRVNISPILALYRDDRGLVREAIEQARDTTVLRRVVYVDNEPFETRDSQQDLELRLEGLLRLGSVSNIDAHFLHLARAKSAVQSIADLLAKKTFYVIDGHHRYETALAYREERRSQAQAWSGDEPENFVLMALIAREDPGVVVLPTHRLLKDVALPADFVDRLESDFAVEDLSASVRRGGWRVMQSKLSEAAKRGVAFGLATHDGTRLILRVRHAADIVRRMPAGSPASWRSLDAAVVEAIVLRGILGIDQQSAAAGGSLAFTHDGDEALRLVESGDCSAAFLLSPAPVEQVLSMADAGERMPQKSTYFYPKLPAGLVMNSLD